MGLESRSGQGFSRPAVARAITASGIVTSSRLFYRIFCNVARAITASGIVTAPTAFSSLHKALAVATAITACGLKNENKT